MAPTLGIPFVRSCRRSHRSAAFAAILLVWEPDGLRRIDGGSCLRPWCPRHSSRPGGCRWSRRRCGTWPFETRMAAVDHGRSWRRGERRNSAFADHPGYGSRLQRSRVLSNVRSCRQGALTDQTLRPPTVATGLPSLGIRRCHRYALCQRLAPKLTPVEVPRTELALVERSCRGTELDLQGRICALVLALAEQCATCRVAARGNHTRRSSSWPYTRLATGSPLDADEIGGTQPC